MKRLEEIAYFSEQVAEMSAFYERLLGSGPVARSDDMAIFVVGETKIFIHRTYPDSEGELPPENHVAFAVDDVDAATGVLQAQGLRLEIEPRDYYWGRSAYLRDPDGHLMELIESKVKV